MKNKIQRITIVCQQGTSSYYVGGEYNGMVIDRFQDNGVDSDTAFSYCFEGLTKEGKIVCSLINLPVEIEYFGE